MSTDTIRQLAAITDAALFERIATSVLRAADSTLYANLSHQGVNTDGKTVKAPLDNVGWISGGNRKNRLVAAAHTTSSRDDLAGKWLHDPTTVTPRKIGGKPTQPQGDLVKAIHEINQLRKTYPELQATLALTCNREEPTEVRIKAETLASAADVTLDIWSVSRIAQFLDTTADGQAIRHEYLGTPATLLSKAELIRAGKMCLAARTQPTSTDLLVGRTGKLSGTGHVILSGASGMGKTTLCLELLKNALENGNAGIILSEHTIQDAVSLEEAIDAEMRRYLPYLEPIVGRKVLEMCNEFEPFIVVIEDICRSQNPDILLRKVVDWALSSISQAAPHPWRNWRLLCPIWPRFLPTLDKFKDAQKAGIIHFLGLYSEQEALEAVKLRGEALGKRQNDISANAIVQDLGRDPLLIGLHEFTGSGHAQDVIAEYMRREFAKVALSSGYTVSDIESAIGRLGFQMLQHKCLQITWGDAMCWLDREDDRKVLRELVNKSNLLRLVQSNGKESIEARHDRVLHSILASCIATRLNAGVTDSFLLDPYFAEQVGTAIVLVEMEASCLLQLIDESPLIAFFALKIAVLNNSSYAQVLYDVIEKWLSLAETQSSHFSTRRILGLSILTEIDSPIILDLTDKFPYSDRLHTFYEARFRNGDFSAGLNLLTLYSMDISIPGQHELVSYVLERYREELICNVEKILITSNSSLKETLGALYLAGYLADSTLAGAVRVAWSNTKPEERNLVVFLWAGAHVCGDEAAITLGPICDAWAALPEPDNHSIVTLSRSSLAAHGLSWHFRDYPPRSALKYFILRAEKDDLQWPITYMLRGVDDPIVVKYLSEYLAKCSRENEHNGGFIDHFVKDEWHRLSKEQGRTMSVESKETLLSIATNTSNDSHLRKQAFMLWEASVSPKDICIAQTIQPGDILYDIALWARVRRHDLSTIPYIVNKIKTGNASYWWQAGRYIWTSEFTALLDDSIKMLGELPKEQHEQHGEWIFPELLLKLDINVTQKILVKHWSEIKNLPRFVQIALFLGTPELVKLANNAIATANDKTKIFKHFSITVGLGFTGGVGLTRESQLESLQPHLKLLSEIDLYRLWEECRSKNWKKFCREHLEPILLESKSTHNIRLRIKPPFDFSELDKAYRGELAFIELWLNNQIRNGGEREQLLSELLTWVSEKGTIRALHIAADIYSKEASRSEFKGFEEIASVIPGYEDVIKRVRFQIYHRTLN
ncbi:ATP-binding protein [Enterobacter asburiae]|uniref:ATP-binding protein n=1 Tax=Enterobacter asburiae TaxID=61645 RepID=UPI002003A268|nr:ATP-binding protein [Enterobacter asburiae]MCK7228563.1 ATP-binding protein [Enterobacter asburiae]